MPHNPSLKLLQITALDYFKIDKPLKQPINMGQGLYLTNNLEHYEKYLKKYHIENIGHLEHKHLISNRPVIFSIKRIHHPIQNDDLLIKFLRDVQGFIFKTWLKKDNNINCQLAFSLGINFSLASSNCLPVFNSCSKAEDFILKVTEEEAKEIASKENLEIHSLTESEMPKKTGLTKNIGRISVANYHIQAARGQRDLGFKISSYCSFFETLFSTDNAELAHQLSQRISFFTKNSAEERLSTYTIAKKAYSIRSKAVHGDMLDKSKKEISEIATHCDNLARTCLNKIIKDEEMVHLFDKGSRLEISQFLTNLLFGINLK